MCGIIGAMTFNGDLAVSEKIRREAAIFIITELLQLTQTRGKDATGISTLFEDGSYIGLKMGIPSIEFISKFGGKETDYDGFLKLWRKEEKTFKIFLGHCRKSSVGNSWDNVNNHPIKVGDIVGVHNGTLTNYEKIFDNLGCKRDGEVDSEAIFRLLNHFSNDGKDPFSEEMIHEVATRLQGNYAVMAFNGNNPYQLASFRDARPIEMALIKPLNMVFIASESKFLKQAVYRLNKQIHIYNTFPEELHLSEENVEYKMMIDDSMSIFDLTLEITEETKIEELFHSKKVLLSDKIWKKETSTTNKTNTNTNTANNTANKSHNAWEKNNNNKTEVNAKENSTKIVGSVWNKAMKTFTPVEAEITAGKKIKCVDIDVDGKTKTDIELPNNNTAITDEKAKQIADKTKSITTIAAGETFSLKSVDNAEKLVCGTPATVIEMRSGNSLSLIESGSVKKNTKAPMDKTSVVVDFTVDPEALKLADKSTLDLKKFKTDQDLIVGLELDSDKVLNKLPLHALANRVQRYAYKLGFYQGCIKGKESLEKSTTTDIIRQIKVISLLLADMSDNNPESEILKGRAIDVQTRKILKTRTDIDYNKLVNMFSGGDLRRSFTLRRIVKTAQNIRDKENKLAASKK